MRDGRPVVTIAIIGLNVASYLLQVVVPGYQYALIFAPSVGDVEPYRFLTAAFLHESIPHIAFNMIALASFGPGLARAWGPGSFLRCYLAAAILGGALQATYADSAVVGASAGALGVLVAWVSIHPHRQLVTLWPRPVAAWKALCVYAALTIGALVFGWASYIAHAAHLGGMVMGALFALNNKPRR